MGCTVTKGAFKLVLHLLVFSEAQPVKTDGRASDISAESLDTDTLMRLAGNGGVERAAVSTGCQQFNCHFFLSSIAPKPLVLSLSMEFM